jgi:hypothetical protein
MESIRPLDTPGDQSGGVDRNHFSVESLEQASRSDVAYWPTQSPAARVAALEELRKAMYGRDITRRRLQRVLEIAELGGR